MSFISELSAAIEHELLEVAVACKGDACSADETGIMSLKIDLPVVQLAAAMMPVINKWRPR